MACIFYNKPCVILSVLFARNFMGISERKFRFFLRSKTIPFMPDSDIKGGGKIALRCLRNVLLRLRRGLFYAEYGIVSG